MNKYIWQENPPKQGYCSLVFELISKDIASSHYLHCCEKKAAHDQSEPLTQFTAVSDHNTTLFI